MMDQEPKVAKAGAYAVEQRPIVQGNTVDDRTAVDELPNPRNPLAIDGAGMDGLDRMLQCVAVSAHTLRDAGYPEETAFELVMAAKHIRRCIKGVDKAKINNTIQPSPVTQQGKGKWSWGLRQARCCKIVVENAKEVEVA